MICGYCQVLALEVVVIDFQIFGMANHHKFNSSCKTGGRFCRNVLWVLLGISSRSCCYWLSSFWYG